jgi:frataxin-like iron-binding protein CyaY
MRKYKESDLSCSLLIFLIMIVCFGFAPAQRAEAQFQGANVLFQNPHSVSSHVAQAGLPASADAREGQDAKEKKDAANVEEEHDLMENALEILEVADNYWKSGDIENTLNELDKAYALLLDTDGDVEIARQKDDLRLLISRRIMAVYSSRQGPTNGKASEIQLIMNSDVEKEIRSFQGPEREFFTSSYLRSGLYRELIVTELKKAGVPEELFWLPLVESGFKVSAYSRARALGLWQFIPSTGYKFGLTRDEWVDERMDVLKSTRAAIAYLKELHSMFGDWHTVLAAYNCGEGRVLRVISSQHINYFDRFWDLYSRLPHETARYVPRFLATLYIVRNPAKYGLHECAQRGASVQNHAGQGICLQSSRRIPAEISTGVQRYSGRGEARHQLRRKKQKRRLQPLHPASRSPRRNRGLYCQTLQGIQTVDLQL